MVFDKPNKHNLKYLLTVFAAVFITDLVLICSMALSFSNASTFSRLLATDALKSNRDGIVSLQTESIAVDEADFATFRDRVDENAGQAVSRFLSSSVQYESQEFPVTAMESYGYPHSEDPAYNNLHVHFINGNWGEGLDSDVFLSQPMIYAIANATGQGFYDVVGQTITMGGRSFSIRGFYTVEKYLSRRTQGDYYHDLYGDMAFVSSAFFVGKTTGIEYSVYSMEEYDVRTSELASFSSAHGGTKPHFGSNSLVNKGLNESMERNRAFYESPKRFLFLIPSVLCVAGTVVLAKKLKRPAYLQKSSCYLGIAAVALVQLGLCFIARKITPSIAGLVIFVKSSPSILALFLVFVVTAVWLLIECKRSKTHLLDPLSDSYIIK